MQIFWGTNHKTYSKHSPARARAADCCAKQFSSVRLCPRHLTFSFELRTKGSVKAAVDPFVLEVVSNAPSDGVVLQTETENQAQERSRTSGPTRVENEQALRSASPQERAQAACAAGREGAIGAIPMLVSMLGDDSKTEPLNVGRRKVESCAGDVQQPSPGEEPRSRAQWGSRLCSLTDSLASANSAYAATAGQSRTYKLPTKRRSYASSAYSF